MMGVLENQAAVITGAGTGIGAAAAVRFVREGASVVIVGRRESKLQEVAREIGDPKRVTVVPGDVVDVKTSQTAVRTCLERFGRVDVVVSNAAVFSPTPFLSANYDDWRKVFDIIMLGSYYLTREGAKAMIERKIAGRIINVTSIHGTQGEANASNYGSAKAAVNQFTRCMAIELAPHNIRVNCVAPGFVDTPMSVYNGVNELENPRFLRQYVTERRIPMARASRPEEIAGSILFLASEDSSYVTGHVLVADGGLTCTF
jgi:NAD(P)-dependent dehydrogenase (short-subunit alcohol dehydrogenase family)